MKLILGIIIGIVLTLSIANVEAKTINKTIRYKGWEFTQYSKWIIAYEQKQPNHNTYEELHEFVVKVSDKCKILSFSGGHDFNVIITNEENCLSKM